MTLSLELSELEVLIFALESYCDRINRMYRNQHGDFVSTSFAREAAFVAELIIKKRSEYETQKKNEEKEVS